MKALVTGGAGFIGSHIAQRLIDLGHEVIIIDDLSAGKVDNLPDCMFYEWDVTWPFINLPIDVVFHNAASKKNICLKDPARDLEVNGGGTLKLLQWSVKNKVKKFIHASTGSVYGEVDGVTTEQTPVNPCSYYGISKLAGESYVRYFKKHLDTTVLRYFHVYGERQEDNPELGGVVAIFKRLIAEGKPITIHGDGNQQRVFTHIDDIVEANIQCAVNPLSAGKVFNCASSKLTTINELAESLEAPKINYADELEGDIRNFNVDSSAIGKLGVTFRDYE